MKILGTFPSAEQAARCWCAEKQCVAGAGTGRAELLPHRLTSNCAVPFARRDARARSLGLGHLCNFPEERQEEGGTANPAAAAAGGPATTGAPPASTPSPVLPPREQESRVERPSGSEDDAAMTLPGRRGARPLLGCLFLLTCVKGTTAPIPA